MSSDTEAGWNDVQCCPFSDVHTEQLLMEEIDHLRVIIIYPHDVCSNQCK